MNEIELVTYRDLMESLEGMSDDLLDQNIQIFSEDDREFELLLGIGERQGQTVLIKE